MLQIVALATPDWISETGGTSRLGLLWQCQNLFNRKQVCFTPSLQIEWLIALILIFAGTICITTTVILLFSSRWDRNGKKLCNLRFIFGLFI